MSDGYLLMCLFLVAVYSLMQLSNLEGCEGAQVEVMAALVFYAKQACRMGRQLFTNSMLFMYGARAC